MPHVEPPETGEGYGELVPLYESQVVVSRETLYWLLDVVDDYAAEYTLHKQAEAAVKDAQEALGNA
jgi:hypothetical protein